MFVSLNLNSKDFTTGLDKAQGHARSSGSSIVGSLSKIGGTVVLGGLAAAGAGVAALVGALSTTIQPASDLAETMSKSAVVFGDWAGAFEDFGDSAATTLGMSKNAAVGAAATYGNLFKSMGIGAQATADMSIDLVSLAADLASFNNMDPTVVLDKLRAGLTGESEPLKTLGININETLLKEEAMRLGLMKGTKVLTAAAKAQASYSLIMKQSTLAQGDFARTSGGLANQQRIFAASIEDLKAKIGTALLPIVNKVMGVLTRLFSNPAFLKGVDSFIEGVGQVTEFLSKVFDSLLGGEDIFISVASALMGLVPPSVITSILDLRKTFNDVVGFFDQAIKDITQFFKNPDWLGLGSNIVTLVWDGIKSIWALVKPWFEENIPKIVEWFKSVDWLKVGSDVLNGIWTGITTVWALFQPGLSAEIVKIQDWWAAIDWPAVGKALVEAIWAGIVASWEWLKTNFTTAVAGLATNAAAGIQVYGRGGGGLYYPPALPSTSGAPAPITRRGDQFDVGGSFTIPASYGREGFGMAGVASASGGERVTVTQKGKDMIDYYLFARIIRDEFLKAQQ